MCLLYLLIVAQTSNNNMLIMILHNSVILPGLIQPTISLEMPVPSQGHYGFHSFPVVD
jgi:hypothetical protein